jgi:hypothetical protein
MLISVDAQSQSVSLSIGLLPNRIRLVSYFDCKSDSILVCLAALLAQSITTDLFSLVLFIFCFDKILFNDRLSKLFFLNRIS